MKARLPFLLGFGLCLLFACPLSSAERNKKRERPPRREAARPTHADVPYGSHERQVFDLYLAKSDRPTPLVLYIHGGGFRGGDKRGGAGAAAGWNRQGISVAALHYRLTDTAPMPAAYLDCARALQTLRHNAKKWNIDPRYVASTGGSAGAGSSLWLAFHDDLADPKSDDPISRESTRLTCAVTTAGQCSYDPRFLEKMGAKRPNYERHPFFYPFYGIKPGEEDTPKAYKLYDEAAPITWLTKDDPPVMMTYNLKNEPITDDMPLNAIVHHPLFGVFLQREMDKLGVECAVVYRGDQGQILHGHPDKEPEPFPDFVLRQFRAAGWKRPAR